MMMSVENTHDRNELHNICITFIGDEREREMMAVGELSVHMCTCM